MKNKLFLIIVGLTVLSLSCNNSSSKTEVAADSQDAKIEETGSFSKDPQVNERIGWKNKIDNELKSNTAKAFPFRVENIESDIEGSTFYYNDKNELVLVTRGHDYSNGVSFYIEKNQLFMIDASVSDEVEEYQELVFFSGKKYLSCYKDKKEIKLEKEKQQYLLSMFDEAMENQKFAKPIAKKAPVQLNFNGVYSWTSNNIKNDMPEASISVKLEHETKGSKSLLGGFSGFVQFGSKLEEGEDTHACKISGTVIHPEMALLQCWSCYSEEIFFTYFFMESGKWHWMVKDNDVTAWVPKYAELVKE